MDPIYKHIDNSNIGYHPLKDNYGYTIDKIPTTLLKEFKSIIDSLQSDFSQGFKFNYSLAGEIKHEFRINPPQNIKNYLKTLVDKFEYHSKYLSKNYNPIPTLSTTELWVNFQQKYEYNPIHRHGGILSFVIWYQIPYYITQEVEQYGFKPDKSDSKHGTFNFLYPLNQYDLKNIPLLIDKNKEGTIAIFPSNLHHTVYPFYSSDDYRITIAGNITGK